ncbi:MAG: G5 domain-containing protein [Candidatus Ancillula sp.]|jgi:hypothetical protein|nr:G5 domain-containing protein [Candidatus Ancillula sp.]
MRRDLLPESEINQFQNEYLELVAEKTNANAEYSKLPFMEEKTSPIHNALDSFKFTKLNILKCVFSLAFTYVLAVSIALPQLFPQILAALEQNRIADVERAVPLSADDLITITREHEAYAENVTLKANGKVETFTTTAVTVNDVIREKQIHFGFGDDIYPNANSIVGDNMTIVVDKPKIKSRVVTEEVAPIENRIEDNSIPQGEERVENPGVVGKRQVTYVMKTVDDNEISRSAIATSQLVEKVDKVIRVGTFVAPNEPEKAKTVPIPQDEVKRYALEQVRARGWSDAEFTCLEPLWARESGWRFNAGNPISGAYGIPQALPGSKMSTEGEDWRDNPKTQVRWGLGYVAGRYGTPCNAWATWQSKGWY